MVILNNSRSEPGTAPQPPPTPTKPGKQSLLASPTRDLETPMMTHLSPGSSASNASSKTIGISQTIGKSILSDRSPDELSDNEDEEFYDWPVSEEEDKSNIADHLPKNPMPPPETPRKAIKFDPFSTPGKRKYDETFDEKNQTWKTPSTSRKDDDIFRTPPHSSRGLNLFAQSGLLSPMTTPTPRRFNDASCQEPELTQDILETLQSHQIVLSPEVQNKIQSISIKHSLFTHGIIKGRDISRSLLMKEKERTAQLQNEIAALHAGREKDKAAIHQLKEIIEARKETDRKEYRQLAS